MKRKRIWASALALALAAILAFGVCGAGITSAKGETGQDGAGVSDNTGDRNDVSGAQAKGIRVTVSPDKRTLAIGKTGSFKATVKGAEGTVKYQWQVSKDGGKTWKKATDKEVGKGTKARVSIQVKTETYGRMFRCMVSAKNGKAYSEAVWINPPNGTQFKYSDNGKGQWTITKYKKDEENVNVPAGFGGKAVAGIGKNVFRGKSLKKVVIPKTVTSIGAYAFENCENMTTVVMSDRVKTFGTGIFRNCIRLSDMKIVND